MAKKNPDIVLPQVFKDIWLTPNKYHLDDRFVIKDGKRHPFAVIVPGGGYTLVCSFIEGVPFARALNKMGISAFIVYYRVKEKALYPGPQDDLAQGVREIFEKADEYMLDTTNYSVWGSSAGGHLAASFGTEHMGYLKYGLPKPRAIVLTYPVISMDLSLTHKDTHDNLLGKDPSAEAERLASIDQNVTSQYPPVYIWCGDADKTVPPDNTKIMAEALNKAGIPYKCEVFPGVDHGVGPGTGTAAEGWILHAVQFWMDQKA